MKNIYRIITFLLIISVSACVSSQSDTSVSNDEDKDIGIGGTGMLANTGSGMGGTGIIGEITGYGSIFVNGVEVEYDNNTVITVNGKTSTSRQLEIGDVVEVLTTDAEKYTQARVINLRHEVIGRVDSVNADTYSYQVRGQMVIHAINKGRLPEVGATVAVSGFRVDEKTILSTRVIPVDASQALLRSNTELPFKGQVVRWMVQAHIKNGKAVFQLDGATHTVLINEKAKESLKSGSGISVLQIHITATGEIKFDQAIDVVDMPRGRQSLKSIQQPGSNMMQNTHPGTMPSTLPGSMPMGVKTEVNRRNR